MLEDAARECHNFQIPVLMDCFEYWEENYAVSALNSS
jgi:hypothetical protein